MPNQSRPTRFSEPAPPNAHLIGVPASRARLVTPALVLELDALQHNLDAMAMRCRAGGIALRPHAKTHKSVRIAKLQMDAGATGICCATIGEAEVLVRGGIAGVLVTSPVVQSANIERLVDLAARADVMAVVDHPDNVAAIAAAAAARQVVVRLLVDCDIGLGRTGASTVAGAVVLAKSIDGSPNTRLMGIQGYAGHLQHIEDYASRSELAAMQAAKIGSIVRELAAAGLKPAIVSGGGTGTHDIDARGGVFTELQAGSYAVMDVEYEDVALTPRDSPVDRPGDSPGHSGTAPGAAPFRPALFVRTTVISNNAAGMVTTDAGLKRFATDGPKPRIASGAPAGAVYAYSGDEHGCVVFADASQTLPLGTALECIVPHCDPTVNLYDHFHCVRGDTLVDLWPVDARGAY